MCGRFALFTPPTDIMSRFIYIDELMGFQPNYNISPGMAIPQLTREADKLILTAKLWGLIPYWAKDITIGQKLINARCETLSEKPSFRTPIKYKRSLIPADGFYEWKNGKPFYFRRRDKKPFYLAGLYDSWHSPDGTQLDTCVIITTQANSLLSQVHHRMPVIISDEEADLWMSREHRYDEIKHLFVPKPSTDFQMLNISRPGEEILIG